MYDSRIRRFSTLRIAEHWIFTLIFMILVITGLSQKFYSLDLSTWVIFRLGGIDYVRLIHRYAGMVCLAVTTLHMMAAVFCITSRKWPPSMVITMKDISDLIHNIRYYLGAVSDQAQCDRYNYRQKFEYWGVLISVFIMIVTGLILWFPIFFTRFLPGEVIPAAQVMHTNHGLLIFLIIALWHVYNSIYSPEIFPLDTSMVTGYISKERMAREHPVEFARMENRQTGEMIEVHNNMKERRNPEMNHLS